eukprot:TRINITY_DN14443_c0_g2_i2.p1 TRINITY_DN14443_c0_g2~~TRINITY_DN14443_c0_g2_i2.p1  ORF type:complete len:217 (+),score=16.32 TRINITY_DN14443_c0_g2_i2:103-753(+)
MASAKSVRLNLVADVTDYGIEEYEESFGIFERSSESFEDDEVFVQSPRETSDYGDCGVSDVVAAVYRAKKLRASVEEDLRQSWRAEAHRSCHTGDSRPAEHAQSTNRSTSLIGQFWRRFGARSNVSACRKQVQSLQSKSANGRRRWGSYFKNNKAKEDAWTQSLCGVGPSNSQTSAAADTTGTASVSASNELFPSPRPRQEKLVWFRARVCPEVPL